MIEAAKKMYYEKKLIMRKEIYIILILIVEIHASMQNPWP